MTSVAIATLSAKTPHKHSRSPINNCNLLPILNQPFVIHRLYQPITILPKMPIPTYSDQDTSDTATPGTAGQASLETLSSTNSAGGRTLGTGSGGTVTAPGSSSASEDRPLSKEEADRLYEERMEEEYAKREGGA
ncbi:hypothetical protein BDV38DRAFT_284735 [Aspergillus pseudotamarii]|uniref:Uncharacterized protein n=1 Tax=Aspergillus pseudotamarii TaxID=132259 RepID=A0A5N6SP23_ASPPS|nr:uncharacterized protein BDV38DRAFT_284735 [Aspergillus pseudotamarii]KAE8135657.1 hypothetical protein BDV38DRAFT_284735 [Aspergillus pseudotamarii]